MILAAFRSALLASDPTLVACLDGSATLAPGAAGAAVARVQQALIELGHPLRDFGPDGVYGPETARAVAAFNAGAGAAGGDPVVGRATLAALDERLAATSPAGEPDPQPAAGVVIPPPPVPVRRADAARAADAALSQVAAGAHHLAGAAGEVPAATGPVTLAPGRTDPTAPAVFAARCEARGASVCAGRFDARNGGVAGARPAGATDTDLIVYLAGLAAVPEEQWTPFFRFFSPRRVVGGPQDGRLVWGEDCRAKRHFDGVGLVNWSLAQALGVDGAVGFEMDEWAAGAGGTIAVPLGEAPRKGDLVLRGLEGPVTHLGFLTGDNGDGGAGHVVLAEQAGTGVVVRRFSPAGWTAHRRFAPGC